MTYRSLSFSRSLVPNSYAVTVAADTATRIDEGAIIGASAMAAALMGGRAHRGVDKLVIQKRADIRPKFGIPF